MYRYELVSDRGGIVMFAGIIVAPEITLRLSGSNTNKELS